MKAKVLYFNVNACVYTKFTVNVVRCLFGHISPFPWALEEQRMISILLYCSITQNILMLVEPRPEVRMALGQKYKH